MTARPAAERRKYGWLHALPCCLSGRIDVEVAHLHEGEGTSHNQKAHYSLTIPLSAVLHRAQHAHGDFWARAFRGDIKSWARVLHAAFEMNDIEQAEHVIREIQQRADRAYLRPFLARAA